jgi:hypothetical protein
MDQDDDDHVRTHGYRCRGVLHTIRCPRKARGVHENRAATLISAARPAAPTVAAVPHCVLHTKRTEMPRQSERRFHGEANIVVKPSRTNKKAATRELCLFTRGQSLQSTSAATLHRFTVKPDADAMSVVQTPVEDRIGNSRFGSRAMPAVDRQLR